MKNYYVNNELVKGAYIVHYDENRETGWVEKVESCDVPDKQTELYPGFIVSIGLDHYFLLDALVAAWYSKHVSCEFTKVEFENFCKSYEALDVCSNEIGILSCQFGFQGKQGYMRIQFDDKVGNLEQKLDDSRFEDNVLEIVLELWDKQFKDIPQVEESSHVGPPGGMPTINHSCHVATYKLERI